MSLRLNSNKMSLELNKLNIIIYNNRSKHDKNTLIKNDIISNKIHITISYFIEMYYAFVVVR